MKDFLIKLSVKWQILRSENGQDLVEYALVMALMCFGATVALGTVATAISTIFTRLGTKISAVT